MGSMAASMGGTTANRLRRVLLVLGVGLLGLAGGCATYMGAQVTAFHQVSPERPLTGLSFGIEPLPNQKDSLEFQAYADLIRAALAQRGLAPAASGATSDLAVTIHYSIDDGKTVTHSYPAYGYTQVGPVWGWVPYPAPGGGVHYVWRPTYPVSYGVIGTSYGASTVYRRELKVEITDRRANGAAGAYEPRTRRFYEGRVTSEGASAALAPVMPAMVKALFHDFPGENGVTRNIQVVIDPADDSRSSRGP